MIKKKDLYYVLLPIIVGFLALIMLMGFVQLVLGEELDYGQCYYNNISVGLNETYNQTIEVCCHNLTVVNETVNITINLFPGQDAFIEENNCNVDAFCHLSNLTSPRCIYEKELDPGDSVNIFSESCDLDIEVNECSEEECDVETHKEYTETYTIKYEGIDDEVEFSFAGKRYRYTLSNNSDFDITNTITYTCPTISDQQQETSAEDILSKCKDVVPVYCTDLTKILMDRFDSCEGRKNAVQDDLDNCQAVVKGSVCTETKAYAELIATRKVCQNDSTECYKQIGKYEREIEQKENWTTELGFACLVLVGFSAFQIFSAKRLKKGAVM